jgi:hypothetical protein
MDTRKEGRSCTYIALAGSFLYRTQIIYAQSTKMFFRRQFNPNAKIFIPFLSLFVFNFWPWTNGLEFSAEYLEMFEDKLSQRNVPLLVILF